MLCEKCHKNEATVHICSIIDGDMQTSDLCSECSAASSMGEAEFAEALRDARCQYCGGQPCAGGSDLLALVAGVPKQQFMCMPCSVEHKRYVQQQLQRGASGLSPEKQLALLLKVNRDADEHMKRWVSERDAQ